jgi:3-hydroxyacyl-[acyl-carrier-protein] dehydratase
MLDIKQIQEILPHRYPFLLIDRVDELIEGKSAKGIKNVSINEYFFQGHFPEEPVMPGVLIIEAIAQLGAIIVMSNPANKGKTAYFGGLDKVKFRHKVVPGDVLKIETEITKVKGHVGVGRGVAYVGDKRAAEGEFTFILG